MTTSPRAEWIFVAIVLLAGGAGVWFWTRREDGVRAEGGRGAASRDDAPAPGLAAPGRAVRSVKFVHPDDSTVPLSEAVEEALRALLDAVRAADGVAVAGAIETLSLALCTEEGHHQELLRRVTDEDLTGRMARAVVLALGRCGREDVLRALVAALEDRTLSPFARQSLLYALAQPREARAHSIVGRTTMGIEDAQISGAIRERFVIDALLREMALAAEKRGDGEVLFANMRALAGTAGDDDAVFDALLAVSAKDGGRRSFLLSSLSLANPSARITEFARRIVTEKSADKRGGSLQGALNLWMKGDLEAAIAYVRSELASPEVADARKALLVNWAALPPPVPDVAIPAVERLVSDATSWARDHPRVVTHHQRAMAPEGAPDVPVEVDVAAAARWLAIGAYRSSRKPSPLLRSLAVDAMVAHLAAMTPETDPRRRERRMSNNFGGRSDEPFLLDLLERLRSAALPDDTLVDVLDAVLRGPAASGPQGPVVLEAVRKVKERLPPSSRAELEERRTK